MANISPEAVIQRRSAKKVSLKISQNSQGNTCEWLLLITNSGNRKILPICGPKVSSEIYSSSSLIAFFISRCNLISFCFWRIRLGSITYKGLLKASLQRYLTIFYGRSRLLMFFKIAVLKTLQISQENACVGVSF